MRPSAIVFDIGDTLVRAARPDTPVAQLVPEPLPGVVATLHALSREHRLGAVTDTAVMSAADVRAVLSGTGISELLEVIVTSSDVGAAKPDPTGLLQCVEALGATPGSALFLGDHDVDEGAARAAGVAFARVTPERSLAAAVRDALTASTGPFGAAAALVGPLDLVSRSRARARQDQLAKPAGSLGRLEELGEQLCAIAGTVPPPRPAPAAIAVFAGDHGVVAQGVSSWPTDVTAQMVGNISRGGAVINALARPLGARVVVVDVGVAGDLDGSDIGDAAELVQARIRGGARDLSVGPALTRSEVTSALDVGATVARRLVDEGARALVTGDMGIGNTTPASAIVAALLDWPAAQVTGRGAGADDRSLARKIELIERGVARLGDRTDPIEVLSEVGGLEHAALAGFIVGAASHRVPVVLDGLIAGSAALVADRLCPPVRPYLVAGHRSTEPGAGAVLDALELAPILDLDLRLGEGSGGCLALTVLDAAARVLTDTATFDEAAVVQA